MQDNNGIVQAVAKLKNTRMSARKMRLSADLVRGVPVSKALGILKFTPKEGARILEKLLMSAIANWVVKTDEDPDESDLVVKAIWVDQGSQLKRYQPAPHGRAHRIRKHSCHVTLVVENRVAIEVYEKEEDTVAEVEEIEGND
jgi:large subunit ribosomal protein L22